ncbi:MAG: ribosomal protein S18-alanine N-acetyltransferase [Desulfurococcales archaeon]|nr:ribosomal protein S18-alanine N-acetyltransferase [Desulfurococcales archaeon]
MEEDLNIRQARRSDLRDIYLIEVNSFPYPYPIEAFLTFLILFPQYFLVAECNNSIVGYVVGSVDSDGSGHVISLAVHPSYRGRGVGRRLLLALEKVMKENGIHRVKLEVSVNNRSALALYKSVGYKVVGLRRNYYPDGSDAYVMTKELSN